MECQQGFERCSNLEAWFFVFVLGLHLFLFQKKCNHKYKWKTWNMMAIHFLIVVLIG